MVIESAGFSIAKALFDAALGKAMEALLDAAFPEKDAPRRELTHSPVNIVGKPEQTRQSIIAHLEQTRKWSRVINFRGLPNRKLVTRVYVELDAYLTPLSDQMNSDTVVDETPSSGKSKRHNTTKPCLPLIPILANSPEHAIILGQAGAGKTTSIQKICSDYFANGKALLNYSFPVVIRLREISEGTPLLGPLHAAIANKLGLLIEENRYVVTKSGTERNKELARRTLSVFLDELGIALLLDGFDEIPDMQVRKAALADIDSLIVNLEKSKIVLTSRTADFPYVFQFAHRFEISSLNPEQIRIFARRWLESKKKGDEFVDKVLASPYGDTAIRPLTIAHLCAVYESTGEIPEKPRYVYRKILKLLIEDWDAQRPVKRYSKYADFESDRKYEFLSALSFELTREFQTTRFNSAMLSDAYLAICEEFGLGKKDSARVAKEIESHSSLIVESGAGIYEFAHKSLQEFLCAEYIVGLPSLGQHMDSLRSMPNELAIAVTLSSKPTQYFIELVLSLNTPPQKEVARQVQARKSARDDRPAFAIEASPTYALGFWWAFSARLALEKADLRLTPLTAVAACIVMRDAKDWRHVGIFGKLLADQYPQILSKYYSRSKFQSDNGALVLSNDDRSLPLPSRIVLPAFVEEMLHTSS